MPKETTAEEIVDRIVTDMTAVLNRKNKAFSKGALDEWRPKLTTSVKANLAKGANWAQARAKVLRVAKDMARIAALISSSKPKVDKAQVHASFRAVKEHVECPGSKGSGRWCDFNV